MPFIEGTALAQQTAGRPWPAGQAVALLRRLALAVGVLHEHGLVHRDSKPANVMMRPEGEPVLLDFGLARSFTEVSRQLTADARLGTPAYMAPEQVLGNASAIGPATDVYALGVILYELLTGCSAVRGQPGRPVRPDPARPAPAAHGAAARSTHGLAPSVCGPWKKTRRGALAARRNWPPPWTLREQRPGGTRRGRAGGDRAGVSEVRQETAAAAGIARTKVVLSAMQGQAGRSGVGRRPPAKPAVAGETVPPDSAAATVVGPGRLTPPGRYLPGWSSSWPACWLCGCSGATNRARS